jgi:tellurite resistance protein TerC
LTEPAIFLCFVVLVGAMLAVDLGISQRTAHFPSMKEAIAWTAVWISISLLFNLFVWLNLGQTKALEFFTGYLVEKALSVDNIFVFIVVLSYFAVPKDLQHSVLFWGVLGAVIFRGLFIGAGAALIARFHWILYLLGAFLIYTAFRLAFQEDVEVQPEKNPFLRYCRKLFPLTEHYEGKKFFLRRDRRRYMTPLFLVLVAIETTDIAFATDSIPAIFAITQDTFIIFTSNIFAILGLRALYFVLAGAMKKFQYLQLGLSFVLGFIGVKMLVEPWYNVSIVISLLTIFLILLVSVMLSMLKLRPPAKE